MTFGQAINIVRGAIPAGEDQIDSARTVIVRDVADALGISWRSEEAERLGDWLAAGEYIGNETPAALAAEWRTEY